LLSLSRYAETGAHRGRNVRSIEDGEKHAFAPAKTTA
jgi:hypothetical protein